jgi:23S rRNA pseudouridine1911/1915/1917 synthase
LVTHNDELLRFLRSSLKKSRKAKSLLSNKQVLVDGRIVTQFNHPLYPGSQVELKSERIDAKMPTIVFEDDDIIVIDKAAGMLSIATDTQKENTAYSLLSRYVKTQNQTNKIFIVHRLDRETSGLMMFARSANVSRTLQESWRKNILERTYVAVIEGILPKTAGTIQSYLEETKSLLVHSTKNPEHGLAAVTHYETLKHNSRYSLVKVNLETGRKNQIRVHMQDLGHSVVGDKKYGSAVNPIGRLALHALVLAFIHPSTGKHLRFETEIPRQFLSLVS